MMDALMMGVGVGGDTKGTGSLKLKEPKQGNYTFTVEDSREGWVELLRTILDGYSNGTLAPKEIDYSRVRLAGTPIKGFGGVSSGPDPLKLLIEDIHKLLSPVAKEEKPLTSTTIVDLFNFIGKCVVSGNIRRSAECMLSDPNDLAFLDLKDPKKFGSELKDRRWASNNSIYAQIGMDYSNVAERTAVNGEPGYLWIDNAREFGRMLDGPGDHDLGVDGANPCLEIMLESFELCNLTEVFPSRHSSLEELKKTLKFAYLYSKTVTLLPTHNERTNAVQLRNRRLGISMSGITQAFTRHGRRQFLAWCDSGYRYLRQIDRKYSRWLCIPESIKLTTTKPSGSVSLLPGVTPGIHYPHSEYYTRNIRFAKDSPMIDILKKSGYKIEPDTYSKQAVVVSVPVHEPHFDRCKDEVSMWEQLENVAQMQTYWADNAVSVTVTFNKNEAKDIKKALELYETRLKSVSFLPLENHGYEQAPYIQMDETAFNKMSDAIKPMRLSLEEGESVKDADDNYCEGDKCIVPLRK
jgi:adenosylcobalamin-dependent ribonucleoside-triphosphate reductase